jgi:proprotein convertase subtilisin/kexin type 5
MTGCTSCSSDNPNNCIGCIPGYFSSLDNTYNPVSNRCIPCLSNCKTCTSSTTCSKCLKGYKLTSDKLRCVSKCSSICNTCVENKYNQCLTCFAGYVYDAALKTCNVDMTCNTTGTCFACPLNMVLVNSYCIGCVLSDSHCDNCLATNVSACSSCIAGYYLDASGSCAACNSACSVCVS